MYLAIVVFDVGHTAVVGGAGFVDLDGLVGGDDAGGVVAGVPFVEEAGRGGEAAGRLDTALGRGDAFAEAVSDKVGIAEVCAANAVARGEDHVEGVAVVGREVESHGSPVLPHQSAEGIPIHVGAGDEVGGAADGVDGMHLLVVELEVEAWLRCGQVVGHL